MTSIQIFDGSDTIGGNKIYIEEKGKGIFLDFGLNFKKHGNFFQEFLNWRRSRGIYDLLQLNLLPKLNIYRKDIIPSDYDISSFPNLNINAILLSHAHLDHFGNIGLLKPDFPIVASPITLALIKGIIDCSAAALGSDAAYFSPRIAMEDNRVFKADNYTDIGRNLICTDNFPDSLRKYLTSTVKQRKKFEVGTISHINDLPLDIEVKAFEVDHSILGATAYLLSGENTIAYTGDFRLHGKRGWKSKEFIKKAKNATVLIIEGTRATSEERIESEELVYENCLKTAENASGLIIADFSARNFERLDIFKKIASNIGRKLIITSKDAFLLNAIEKAEGVDRLRDLLIYGELKITQPNWEKYLNEKRDLDYVDPTKISKNQDNYLLCFSFFDMKNLLDIKPNQGTYIYSSSEAFEEESEFDFVRLNNWLKYLGFDIHGFEVIEEGNRLKPKFSEGYHASGHASKSDLINTIENIDPDVIVPVHTDNPAWFSENFDNVVILKENEKYTI